MKKIERTKKNIKITSLNEHERKRLFNTFIDAGGQIIEEKERQGLSDFDRETQKKYLRQLEKSKKQANNRYNVKKRPDKNQKKKSTNKKTEVNIQEQEFSNISISKLRLFTQRLIIKFRLFFMKVTDITGTFFTPKFLQYFDEEYKQALLSLQIVYVNLFKQKLKTGKRIIVQLDKMNPIYFELIELLSNLFDRSVINEILEHYYNFPTILQSTDELEISLTNIFKKIYPLVIYRSYILNGYEKAFNIYLNIENDKSYSQTLNKRKIKNDIYIIFNKLYPRLYWLMCNYKKRIFLSDRDIENSIPISTEDMPGRRKKNLVKTFELPLVNDASATEDENNNGKKDIISDSIKDGLALMYNIDLKKIDISHFFKFENFEDKVFITSLLFNEFDREYSFILTTNKIKYNAISRSGQKLDYRNKLINIYNKIGSCNNRIKDYADTFTAFEKLKQEKPISNTQYIEYSNRLSALSKERNQIGTDTRMHIKGFFENLCDELKNLINDMDNEHDIIANPQNIIIFDTAIEGEKKLNGKTIYEAITTIYNYAMAFIYRLSLSGDLIGDPDINEDEKKKLDTNSLNRILVLDNEKKDNKQKETDKDESILKELDDLI